MQTEIEIRYFAILREQRGRHGEMLEDFRGSPRELYAELALKHGFTLADRHLRVAVNDRFVDWDVQLNSGDRVAFIPPVAGG